MSNRLSPPRIVCAAIEYVTTVEGVYVVVGPRHYDKTMRTQITAFCLTDKEIVKKHQGFIDQHGTFYDRREAWKIAEANKQIIHRCGGDTANGGTLYSENLY